MVEPFDIEEHLPDLFEALSAIESDWTYLPYGPFEDIAAFREWAETMCLGDDPLFYTVRDNETGKAAGVAQPHAHHAPLRHDRGWPHPPRPGP